MTNADVLQEIAALEARIQELKKSTVEHFIQELDGDVTWWAKPADGFLVHVLRDGMGGVYLTELIPNDVKAHFEFTVSEMYGGNYTGDADEYLFNVYNLPEEDYDVADLIPTFPEISRAASGGFTIAY